jgi:hypothetical protein
VIVGFLTLGARFRQAVYGLKAEKWPIAYRSGRTVRAA